MVNKMVVSLSQKPVAISQHNQSTLQYVQDLARHNDNDSFFVADLGQINALVKEWFANLPRVHPFFSLNCNNDELLLNVLTSYPEIGLYCSSRQQMELALDFAEPERLYYSNPSWTRNALVAAHTNNIALLGFDSEADLSRMAKNGVTNKLVLNVCMSANDESPIGCAVSKAPELLQLAADFGLDCIGIGFNICGQRLGLFDSMIECAAQLFAIGRSMGLKMSVLNLGGGFPNSFSQQQDTTFEQISAQLNTSLDYYFPPCTDVQILATPGRYFASTVFSLATRIVDVIEVDASLITNDDFDAGQRAFTYKINEGYYGAFGSSIMPNCEPKCIPLFADDGESQLFNCAVKGPVDDDFDVVQKQCYLRQMKVGEWLIFQDMGSYSLNNCSGLDDEPAYDAPKMYYFSKENNWKFSNDSDGEMDGETSSIEDNAIELDDDPLWTMFDWPIV